MEEFVCPRCGNKDPRLIAYRNGKPYCRACLSFAGRDADFGYHTKHGIRLELSYTLSPKQNLCAKKALEGIKGGKNVLIHAVTGAGKTELVYPSMAYILEKEGHVGFATPRKDVVIDLLPRIQEAFPKADCVAVYGGHTQKLEGDIIILTSHQFYRYPDYFDLLVFDEIDAFPYRGDRMLKHFFKRSVRGNYILLSATPSLSDIEEIHAANGIVIELFERYHGGLLPVPETCIVYSLFLAQRCAKLLKELLSQDKPVFVFTPTIAEGERLFRFLSLFFKGGAFVSSKAEERKIDIERFKKGERRYLVTTSILERGVTVKDLQVIVYNSASDIYDAKSLIQIAGRVGRKIDSRGGKVYFLADEVNKAMEEAIDEIKAYNRRAFVPNLSQTHEG